MFSVSFDVPPLVRMYVNEVVHNIVPIKDMRGYAQTDSTIHKYNITL